MDEFIKITHEAYYKRFSNEFGKTMPAIFTDEPQTIRTLSLDRGFSKKDAHGLLTLPKALRKNTGTI